MGGTFDGLHKGHRHFLAQSFRVAAHVTIGLTSEVYIHRFKRKKHVSPFSRRYSTLIAWLRKEKYAERTTIIPLDDQFGPAILGSEFDAIAVTRDNHAVALTVNSMREARGFVPLAIVEIDLIRADDALPISSTRIREKEIDTEGRVYLPGELRSTLQQPMGKLHSGDDIARTIIKYKDEITVSVGDMTTRTFFFCGVQPSLAIIDLHVERKPFLTLKEFKFPKKYSVEHVQSGPGFIAKGAINFIKDWAKTVRTRQRKVLVVDGEEDLLALPAIVYAPIGSIVFYGQPKGELWACGPVYQGGVVEVQVTQEKQDEASSLLAQFDRRLTSDYL